MILYGSSLSPFVRKVLVFAAEKGIALELKGMGLQSDDPDFRSASPFGKMPAFRDPDAEGGDFAISDSSAIIAYLDALRPEPNLIPTEARARARCIWFEEFADGQVMECGRRLFFNRVVAPLFMGREGDLAAADAAEREMLPPLLDYLETQVPASNYLVEDRFTLADIAVASPFLNVIHHLDIAIDPARYPKTIRYLEHIHARPTFALWLEKEQRLMADARARLSMPAAS